MCRYPADGKITDDNQRPMEEGNDVSEDETQEEQSEPTDSDDSYYTETSSANDSGSESDAESASGNRVITDMGNDVSEDETQEEQSEPTDSDDSYYTETSSANDSGSESDAESASGNRVTTDMVLLLMLKEKGMITEEKYEEKVEKCTENVRSLIPVIPRTDSSDTIDYTKGLSDDDENSDNLGLKKEAKNLIIFIGEILGENHNNESPQKASNELDSHKDVETVAKDIVDDVEMVENKADIKDTEANANGSPVNDSTKHSIEEKSQQLNDAEIKSNEDIQEPIEKREELKTISENNETHSASNIEQAPVCENMALPESLVVLFRVCVSKMSSFIRTIIEGRLQGEDDNTTREKLNNILNENQTVKEDKITENQNNEAPNENKQCIETKADTKETKSDDLKAKNKTYEDTNKKTKSFRYILSKLVKGKRNEYGTQVLCYFYDSNKDVDLFDEENYELVEFALLLNFYSPSSYKYVIETYNTPLPDHKTLYSWYLKDDEQPGLTKSAFNILKQKASKQRLTCALMFGDIFLKNHGRYYDQVDYGGGCNYDYTDKAVMTYVFLLVSLEEDWKIPLGYIFARNIPAESQAEFIRICLTHCHEAGADVVAVTLETPTPAEYLGCSFRDLRNLKTTFKHPDCDRRVAVWIDPCLALKSVRHTLKYKGVLKDDAGGKIRWNLIRKLRKLRYDDDDMLEFDKPGFSELRNHIAKIGLTTETFSESLAPALKLCEELLPDTFRDTRPTRKYIEKINTLYYILNARKTTNLADVKQHLERMTEYLIGFFCNEDNELSRYDRENHTPDKAKFKYGYRHFVDGEPACGFIAFLICIESFKYLYFTLVKKERRINTLDPQRLCKVHVEGLVKNLRAYDWSDPDYFCGHSFQSFYRRLFDELEKNGLSDQKLPLEHWAYRERYHPTMIIKLTSGKRFYDDIYSAQYRLKKLPKTSHEERTTKLVREYSRAMDSELNLVIRKNMVGYLAGWIAAKFSMRLKCEKCINAMVSDERLWFHTFITFKDLKGLCFPSEEVFRICWECERVLKLSRCPAKIRVLVLRRLMTRFPWSNYRARHHPLHYLHLVRAVIAKYIPLRVLVPFSSKDRKRIIDKMDYFSCMTHSELEEELDGAADDFEEED